MSEMLPPPRRPPPSETPLRTNADFRQFLDTPRRTPSEDPVRQANKQKQAAQPKKKSYRPRPEKVKEEEDEGEKYR